MVAVGVTGHRSIASPAAVEIGIDQALESVRVKFPDQPMVVVSSLAEGADRLAARRALDGFGATLVVSLPLPHASYMEDFDSEASRREFSELVSKAERVVVVNSDGSRSDAYLAAGLWLLNHSDVLLAVWDGEEPRGRGGTAHVVDLARQRGLPIAWVHGARAGEVRVAEASESGAARLTLERF